MPLFSREDILTMTGAREISGPARRRGGVARLWSDSREVKRGDLFIALSGERFDGHRFVGQALKAGAVGALIQDRSRLERDLPAEAWLLEVPDTLRAYQDLASAHRARFDVPVVAVTGSNGKTTTKEMVAQVLAQRWTVLKTEGNLNNRIGVPQTLLRLRARHEAAVIEMGVDAPGQTTRLCEIVRPTLGVITNIGPDHLEFFGTLDASARAKGELIDGLPSDGTALLNADDPYFESLAARAACRVLAFGLSPRAQVRGVEVEQDARRGLAFRLLLPGRARATGVTLRTHGVHNLSNALAAAAVGHALGLGAAAVARGLARFKPAAMRSQVLSVGGFRIINDCYNANPASMKAALDLLVNLAGTGRSIAVLGDMLELGPETGAWHEEVGRYLAERRVSRLVVAGGLGRRIADGARAAGMPEAQIHEADDARGAASIAVDLVEAGDAVLVKASRGMRMERVVEALQGR